MSIAIFNGNCKIEGRSIMFGPSAIIPKDYFVGFENPGETENLYAGTEKILSGLKWFLGPQALVGTTTSDMKFGGRAGRIRYSGGVYGSITMLEDTVYGIKNIILYYARSNFSGDRTGNSPIFIVEYSVDSGLNWIQAGPQISLSGVDTLTEFKTAINLRGKVRIRIRQIGGDAEKRWNIDNITLETFI